MKDLRLVMFFVITILVVTACQNYKSKSELHDGGSELLYKFQWNLVELGGKLVETSAPPFLKFNQETVISVSGNTGCNSLMGTVQLESVKLIKFLPMATTKKACLGDNIEAEFLNALAKADNWSINVDELSLSQGKDLLLKFKGLPPEPEVVESIYSPLNGIWELKFISGPRIAFDGIYPEEKPQLIFKLPSLDVDVHTSCNEFNSTFVVDSNTIVFNDPAVELKPCEGIGESTFLEVLMDVQTYTLEDSVTLALFINDVAMMRFTRK